MNAPRIQQFGEPVVVKCDILHGGECTIFCLIVLCQFLSNIDLDHTGALRTVWKQVNPYIILRIL